MMFHLKVLLNNKLLFILIYNCLDMPESVRTIFYQQIKEEEMKVKQIMNSTGSTINKKDNPN